MKDFSNETKSKRRKAILKVILKRYSFIVWLPLLLIICNFIGVAFLSLIGVSATYEGYSISNVILGFMIGGELLLSIIFIGETIKDLIKYLKRGTIIKDFIKNIKHVAETLVDIFVFCILIPKKIFIRIKDEKRRFNNALQEEIEKK